jgi:uncharacterized protein YjbI with pentapeptide repeats
MAADYGAPPTHRATGPGLGALALAVHVAAPQTLIVSVSGHTRGGRGDGAEQGRRTATASLGPVAADQPLISPDVAHEGVTWSGGVLDEVDAEDAAFVDCAFTGLTVAGGRWERSAWRSCELAGVRFAGVRLARSRWLDVRLDGCALSGSELLGAQLRKVRFSGGVLDVVNLRGASLEDVTFEDCRLREVDLGGARLTGVTFPGCRIERLDLTKATLARVDLRRAELDVARGLDRLGGAILEVGQVLDLAPALAAQLGIDVRQPE